MFQLWEELPQLPPFTLQIEEADELLGRPQDLPQLAEEERTFLRGLYQRTMTAIRSSAFECRPLHGESNVQQTIPTSSGLLWLDFEAACLGPIEWDLANIDISAVAAYGLVDHSILPLVRTARRLCTVTWCWAQPDRAPEIREAAEYHLKSLKGLFGPVNIA